MIRCEPDKTRFSDPEAPDNAFLVHTVEMSDERSVRQFVTFWTKGPAEKWMIENGLDGHHNRDVYHREVGPWLPQMFPGKESKGWSTHYHLDLDHLPAWSDLERFLPDVPAVIQDEVRLHLGA